MADASAFLSPDPPFVWPEPRVAVGLRTYEHEPPFNDLVRNAASVVGLVSALSDHGIDVLESWLRETANLRIRLAMGVYPACATRTEDLERLLRLTESHGDRLEVRIYACLSAMDRPTNALCVIDGITGAAHLAAGSSENLGFDSHADGKVNLVFRAEPALVEAFSRYLDFQWTRAAELSTQGVRSIPALAVPGGDAEGARLWMEYVTACGEGPTREVAQVDSATGDVSVTAGGSQADSVTKEMNVPRLDPVAARIAQLYNKGLLVSIDKLSRIPPLDAPLNPSWFGDASELQRGNVIRRVSMRVSIIDETTLKEINKRRGALRPLLNRFTFGLADNIRWMPSKAQALFESELERVNSEGQRLITDLLKGDARGFVAARKPELLGNIGAMLRELGQERSLTEDAIGKIVQTLEERLKKAQSARFMPKLSYSGVAFHVADNEWASPWGQAYSLLADVAEFPRKALTDPFFFRGLRVSEEDLIEAMNVLDDAILRERTLKGIKDRCKRELELLDRIETSSLESREKCDLVLMVLADATTDVVEKALLEEEPS